ncbi:beta-glucosidase [Lachnospiraceae bacterium KM106-2]|nr:beta-glucosidase [Lachnospiraceae bacterium KM106-2]
MRVKKNNVKGFISFIIAFVLIMTYLLPQNMDVKASTKESEFQRESNGKPIFSGKKEDLDAFVNVLIDDMLQNDKNHGWKDYTTEANYNIHILSQGGIKVTTDYGTYTMPSGKGEVDAVQGVHTDFGSLNALGMTWNNELLTKVGTVIGKERRGDCSAKEGMTLLYSALCDTRINPLSGRFDEGYSEDANQVGTMVNAMADGITGKGTNGNQDGFYVRVGLGTKHYSTYASEWFRREGSYHASVRALMEYQLAAFKKSAKEGSVQGVMTSYGRTNGVPNAASPLLGIIESSNSDYRLWNVADFQGENSLIQYGGNGYDKTYCNNKAEAAALLMLSGATENSGYGTNIEVADVLEALDQSIWGVTEKDLHKSTAGLLELFVREGCFSKDGDYPFEAEAGISDNATKSVQSEDAQKAAYQSSYESMVLLKNQNQVLPLEKEDYSSDSPIDVYGYMANARLKTTYAANTPKIAHAGLTTLGGIKEHLNKDQIEYRSGNKIVAFQGNGGTYLTVSDDKDGAELSMQQGSENGKPGIRQQFELYAFGMNGYGIKSQYNQKWLGLTKKDNGWTTSYEPPFTNAGTADLTAAGEWNEGGTALSSSLPDVIRLEEKNNQVRLILGSYQSSFTGGAETAYQSSYVVSAADQKIEVSKSVSKQDSNSYFTMQEIKQSTEKKGKTAIVEVGVPSRFSSGEGADRTSLEMAKEAYDLVAQVADDYDKVIVIVRSDAPVIMKAIQDNDKVDAIIYEPYSGQYDGYAMGNLLFGDTVYGESSPSGRLTSTWYESDDVLPRLDAYSLPEGGTVTLKDIDPRYKIDLTNADPIETKLTYQYCDENKVTYPFGYGLSYTNFIVQNTNVQDSKDSIKVTAKVSNTGKVAAQDTIQIYAKPLFVTNYKDSIYQKKLIGYTKVSLKAGESKTVTIDCDKDNMMVYDVNAKKNIVAQGKYMIFVAESSTSIKNAAQLNVSGSTIANLDPVKETNVADHTAISKDVIYRERSKAITARMGDGLYATEGKKAGSYVMIPNVVLSDRTELTLSLANASDNDGRVDVYADSVNGKLLGSFVIAPTKGESKKIVYGKDRAEKDKASYQEIGYESICSKIANTTGVHNLYVVFRNTGVRVDSMKLN